jgi:E3 ubiquitin-protein ligase RGLG
MGCTASTAIATSDAPSSALGFRAIRDNFETLEQVQEALRKGGLESSQLMVGIDFTKSNTWTGKDSFGGRSLHTIQAGMLNPYQEVISIIGRTLEAFDDDNLIPAYGFGDVTTGNTGVFQLGSGPCHGVSEILDRYTSIAPTLQLSGPTSFVPILRKAMEYVHNVRQYTILLIIADGQVNDQEATAAAIVEASHYPLSIVVCGVGDGPFGLMEHWDDNLPSRKFDNLQFVNFTEVCRHTSGMPAYRDSSFALAALQEVPEQYKAIQRLRYV